MRTLFKPLKHQQIAIEYTKARPSSGLLLDMGLGKTSATLTVLLYWLDTVTIRKPLIVGPKFVAESTWPDEIAKWKHLDGLTYSVMTGTEKQRIAALQAKADIYIISRDNIAWLVLQLKGKWPFDCLILDELSSFKSSDSRRFKAVRKILPRVKKLIGLTGTPLPNGYMDLWAQMFLLDRGQRLSVHKTSYRMTYFSPIKQLAHGEALYALNHGAEELIIDKIKDICLSMKSVDWLDLPERQDVIKEIVLDDYTAYNQFKKDKVLEIAGSEDINAFNATTLYTKLLQYANGAVYDTENDYHVVHNKKLDALEEAIEELQGKPVIIFYQFKSDVERIKVRIKDAVLLKKKEHIEAWNRKEVRVMLAHAASAGHGLNLQHGGNHIFWFGVGPNMEWYWQAVKRLDRQGQTCTVFNYHFLVKGTAEFKVYTSIQDKTLTQDRLMEALK